MPQETLTASEYRARHAPKPKGKKTGRGNALSSPVPPPDAPAGTERHPHASSAARAEYGARWKRGESVFLVVYHHAGRTRDLCVDADALLRLFARARRANSHSVHIHS